VEGEQLWQEHFSGERECFICYTTVNADAVNDHVSCRHTMCVDCCGKWLGTPNFTSPDSKDELQMVGKCPLCKNIGCWVNVLTRENILPVTSLGEPIPIPTNAVFPYRLWGWHRRNRAETAAYTSPLFDKREFLAMAKSMGKLRYTEWQYAGKEADLSVLGEYFTRMAETTVHCDGCGEDPTDHRKVCGGRACDCRLCLRCVFGLLYDQSHNTYRRRAVCVEHNKLNRWELLNDTSQREVWAEVYLRENYPSFRIPQFGSL
jgi:hypothetical protein